MKKKYLMIFMFISILNTLLSENEKIKVVFKESSEWRSSVKKFNITPEQSFKSAEKLYKLFIAENPKKDTQLYDANIPKRTELGKGNVIYSYGVVALVGNYYLHSHGPTKHKAIYFKGLYQNAITGDFEYRISNFYTERINTIFKLRYINKKIYKKIFKLKLDGTYLIEYQ